MIDPFKKKKEKKTRLTESAYPDHMKAQEKYCREIGMPHFAPKSGVCYSCKKDLYEGMSLESASSGMTSCPHCRFSFCD